LLKHLSAKEAKYGFGRLIDLARLEPVVIEKHGRPVVVVLAIEEFERLNSTTSTDNITDSSKTAAPARSELDRL
jgi:prevent-host-death family protein